MKVEEHKKELINSLNEVENEAKTLLERIEKARAELQNVKTHEDMDKFCEANDIEEGFKHIELF